MKRFIITFTENDNYEVECRAVNEGFTGMELIGLLEVKKADILKQFTYPNLFKRYVVDDDNEMKEIIEESEDTK